MEFIMNNWYIILALLAVLIVVAALVYRFFKLPTDEQLTAVREWLLGAVTEAEKELGSGTGQLKLHIVYDRFVVRFPWVAQILPFDVFSSMVDDALAEMRILLTNNEKVRIYVEGAEVK